MPEFNGTNGKANVTNLPLPNYGWQKNMNGRTATDVIIDFGLRMQANEVQMPRVPSHLRDRVLANSKRLGISTESCADPMDTYRMSYIDWVPSITEQTPYDFMVFAHAGHGINSYAMGLIARLGNITVFQQSHWGGAYQNPIRQVEELNAHLGVWNEMSDFLAAIETTSEYEYLISFSPMRKIASILRRHWQSPWILESDATPLSEQDRKWEVDIDLMRNTSDAQVCLDWLAGKPDYNYTRDLFIQEIGREYLYRLIVANEKMYASVKNRAQKAMAS
jgi:hypothetical protein